MANVILLTDEELQQKINTSVERTILYMFPKKAEPRKTNLGLDEAIEFLSSIGYKCSKSLIYKKTMNEEIVFTKYGRKISFNTSDLEKWAESKKQKTVDISMAVAQSANSKTIKKWKR